VKATQCVGATVAVCAALALSCGKGPMTPDAAKSTADLGGIAASGVRASNLAPILRYRTTPASAPGSPNPVVSGQAPLIVTFNLCQSEDPDPGDSLNWQFNFGDTPRPAFNPDGSFNPDFDQFCRIDHTYSAGTYVATLSVTDKHAEDQSKGVSSLARATQRLTIQAMAPAPAECTLGIGASGWLASGGAFIATVGATNALPFNLSCTCAATGTTVSYLSGPPLTFGPFYTACRAAGGFPTFTTGGACGCQVFGPA
jgi:hypothetical protein